MKLVHSIKFRFISLFTLFNIALCSVMGFLSIRGATDMAIRIFAEEGTGIVEKAANIIDGDSFERLCKTLDDRDPFYEETRIELLAIKNHANCLYLYTMAPLEGSIYMYIIDGSAPPWDEEMFSPIGLGEDTAEYDDAFRRCWAGKSPQFSGIQYQEGWGWLVSVYAPILNSKGDMVGIAGCDFDAENIHKTVRENAIREILISVAFLIAGFALMFVFIRLIFNRLRTINGHLKEIADGEGDLTQKVKTAGRDEIDELGEHFNRTIDKIKNLIIAIKERTATLFNIGNELTESMKETASVIRQITGNIQEIKMQVINQSASVTETNATMQQVTTDIDRLNTHVEMQTASVAGSSSAIEEMLANIRSVTQTLICNSENVNELTAASEAGRSGLEEVFRDIQAIAKESEGLLQINAVMENISSQTNLLSMNAAIEAAHAGEAGRGFAVVAGEIRKLAENSGKQSKTISDVLSRISKSINKIIALADTVLGKFQAIDSGVKTVSEQEEHIRHAMEEQGQGSQQILDAVGKLNDLTQRVRDGSNRMLEGSREVILESKNLEEATVRLTDKINTMAAGTSHINDMATRGKDAGRINKEHIDELVSEVSKFRVE